MRALMMQVIRNEQPRRNHLGDRTQVHEVTRLLLPRQRLHAAHAELDALRDHDHGLGLFGGSVLVLPEGVRSKELALGR